MILKFIKRAAVALIIATTLGFALLQYLSISALDKLIEEAESQTATPPVWDTAITDPQLKSYDLVPAVF